MEKSSSEDSDVKMSFLEDDPKKDQVAEPERETFPRKFDFALACCGFSIGLGNVWKFPFLCYKNGGGAFLIPYFIAILICSAPLFILEVSIGQFMSRGGLGAWNICPLFQGLGLATMIVMTLLNCTYSILLTWIFRYLFASFTPTLPWTNCQNDWNTELCRETHNGAAANTTDNANATNITAINTTIAELSQNITVVKGVKQIFTEPVTEFWERKVLRISEGIDHPGTMHWDLVLCLLLSWIVVYFCIWKGIKSSGKVMYVTATTPYLIMLILLVRGVTLDGAIDGIKFYLYPDFKRLADVKVMYVTATTPYLIMLKLLVQGVTLNRAMDDTKLYLYPDFKRLADVKVWTDAGNQLIFSCCLGQGVPIAFGSYNKFRHNGFRDSIIFSTVNSLTSLLAGFVIFSILGFMSKKYGVPIEDVAESGPGLAFIAYPEALSQLPGAQFWSFLFFLMLIFLGIDSQFGGVESVITGIMDLYPKQLRGPYKREILVAFFCLFSFLVSLSMVTEGGMYVFQLMDFYSSNKTLFIITLLEALVISYAYGLNRFADNIQMMYGPINTTYLKMCWSFITPVFILILLVFGIVSYADLTYDRKIGTYYYPKWAIGIGWVFTLGSVLSIPIISVYKLWNTKGSLIERLRYNLKPVLRIHQIRDNEDYSNIVFVEPE